MKGGKRLSNGATKRNGEIPGSPISNAKWSQIEEKKVGGRKNVHELGWSSVRTLAFKRISRPRKNQNLWGHLWGRID